VDEVLKGGAEGQVKPLIDALKFADLLRDKLPTLPVNVKGSGAVEVVAEDGSTVEVSLGGLTIPALSAEVHAVVDAIVEFLPERFVLLGTAKEDSDLEALGFAHFETFGHFIAVKREGGLIVPEEEILITRVGSGLAGVYEQKFIKE
jgi:hypothetical protein